MLWDIFIITILALFGIALIILEVFVIPGFGFVGIGGIAFLAGSVWFAYEQLGTTAGTITLCASCIFLFLGIYRFIKGKMLNRMSLKKEIVSKAPNRIEIDVKEGQQAMTLSILNPMGTILLDGKKIEAKSEDGFVEAGRTVEIIRVFPTSVLVREI